MQLQTCCIPLLAKADEGKVKKPSQYIMLNPLGKDSLHFGSKVQYEEFFGTSSDLIIQMDNRSYHSVKLCI